MKWNFWKPVGNNFGEVTSNIYRSAELSQTELIKVRDKYQIDRMLNLRDDLPNEEIAEIIKAGIKLTLCPMSDTEKPTNRQIETAINTLTVRKSAFTNDSETILVCCKGGRHRTGLIIAVFRVLNNNATKEAAWSEAEKYNFYSFPNHGKLKEWFFEDFDPNDYK
jgi:protein-tyrosine phosphatase